MARMDGEIRTTSPRAPGGAGVGTGEELGAVVRDDLAKREESKWGARLKYQDLFIEMSIIQQYNGSTAVIHRRNDKNRSNALEKQKRVYIKVGGGCSDGCVVKNHFESKSNEMF